MLPEKKIRLRNYISNKNEITSSRKLIFGPSVRNQNGVSKHQETFDRTDSNAI